LVLSKKYYFTPDYLFNEFFAAANKSCTKETAIWRMSEINPSEEIHSLEMLTKLNTESLGEDIKCSHFHPSEENKVLTVIDGNFAVWDIQEAGLMCEVSKST
jgi:hypothetical protein